MFFSAERDAPQRLASENLNINHLRIIDSKNKPIMIKIYMK
jgi:hypothetical protein